MSTSGSKHLDVESRCGACGDVISDQEICLALYGNAGPDALGYLGHTDPFSYPPFSSRDRHDPVHVGKFRLCRSPRCDLNKLPGMGTSAPEAVTVHHACFHILVHACAPSLSSLQAKRRLFITGLYRNPWPRAHPLSLAAKYDMSRTALAKTASISGLPQLAEYPVELLEMVRQYDPHSIFWRTISVLTLAERLCNIVPEPLIVVPIHEIVSWKRGSKLERWIPPDELPEVSCELSELSLEATPSSSKRAVVRMTIDAQGINKIELLSDRPPYDRDRTESVAFMVEELAALRGLEACFMDGLVQLSSSSPLPSLRIWDTPAPPSLSQCTILSDKKMPWRHFRTVELGSISGLTFFYRRGSLLGIHPHRSKAPCASSSRERLSERGPVSWIYYPLPPSDRVLIFGARPVDGGVNILIRTHLSGDTVIGSWGRAIASETWRRKEPTTLIYCEPPDGYPVPYLGTYCHSSLPDRNQQEYDPDSSSSTPPSDPRTRHKLSAPFMHFTRQHVPRLSIQPGSLLYFSVAPLRHVASIQAFYSHHHHHPEEPRDRHDDDDDDDLFLLPEKSLRITTCQGLIVNYRNGGSRALGQVRLQVDEGVTVQNPTHALLTAHGVGGRTKAWIKFVKQQDLGDGETLGAPGEMVWPLSRGGALRWWFSDLETHIGFRDDD